MKIFLRTRECLIWVLLVIAARSLSAQLVNDGATNTLNNTTNTVAGDVTVGTNGSFSALILTNNTLLTNSADGVIGRNTGANSNAVVLASPGARWLMTSNLTVGNSGSFNRLLVSGAVRDNAGHLGYNFNSNTNTALVTGPGALWSNASNLFIGVFGVANRLVVTNGGLVQDRFGYVGYDPGSANNAAVVTGTNSMWSNAGDFFVGNVATGNQLIITNGGLVQNTNGLIGGGAGGNGNMAVVTGPGSLWNNFGSFFVGYSGSSNRLLISNGGTVQCNNGQIGLVTSNNVAIVTDTDSVWSNAASFIVGNLGGANQLIVSNGGTVFVRSDIYLGLETNSTRNRTVVDGGTLRATNSSSSAFDIRRGTNVLNSGLIEVSRLLLTNAAGAFEFNGGTLVTGRTTNDNGRAFVAGNGTSSAALVFRGGLHFFANGLVIASNASSFGNGTIVGTVTVASGGALAPGLPVGVMSFSNSPVLQGRTAMEIGRNELSLTNDQIQVSGPITYGGSLTVSNIGPTTLILGDRFKLFNATSYAGSFSALSLPPPPGGLDWTNKLLVDGSIELIEGRVPKFGSITVSGTNVVITGSGGGTNATYAVLTSTNVALPLSNWVSIATNPFSLGGNFSFTNAVSPTTPQRFYRLRSP